LVTYFERAVRSEPNAMRSISATSCSDAVDQGA
jgi:hypothetical protein